MYKGGHIIYKVTTLNIESNHVLFLLFLCNLVPWSLSHTFLVQVGLEVRFERTRVLHMLQCCFYFVYRCIYILPNLYFFEKFYTKYGIYYQLQHLLIAFYCSITNYKFFFLLTSLTNLLSTTSNFCWHLC